MKIGIDASRAFLKNRTGIEEYSYQVIRHLRNKLTDAEVILYIRPRGINDDIDKFNIPQNWEIKKINFCRFWTQIGLSLEMLLNPVDILFIPAHTVPIINPSSPIFKKIINLIHKKKINPKTVVTIHGLEYEFLPKAYSFWERFYMRLVIKKSCKWADKIIAVSKNTKKDLIRLYKVPAKKIEVVYEGFDTEESVKKIKEALLGEKKREGRQEDILEKYQVKNSKYLLFLGRIEERKNIRGIIDAFKILKEKYNVSHKLLLVGGLGYGYSGIMGHIKASGWENDVYLTGFIDEIDKREILRNADVFLFPTLYEGFGLPIIEAQSLGVPIVASNNSSIPEIVGSAMISSLVDPLNSIEIAGAVYDILANKNLKKELIKPGLENVKRFSWGNCAQEIADILLVKK